MKRIRVPALAVFTLLIQGAGAFASVEPTAPMAESYDFRANVTLTFSVAIDAVRSIAQVVGPSGPVLVGKITQGRDRTELVVPLNDNLPPGTYTVTFTAVTLTGDALSGTSEVTVGERTPTLPTISLTGSK